MSIPSKTTVLVVVGGPGGSYTASALVRERVKCRVGGRKVSKVRRCLFMVLTDYDVSLRSAHYVIERRELVLLDIMLARACSRRCVIFCDSSTWTIHL